MSGCPFHHHDKEPESPPRLRDGLPAPMPVRIQALPVDERGYPVPWFVAWLDGKPDFRVADPAKIVEAIKEKRCWVCGGFLGRYMAMVLWPMCVVNRNSAEPPMHLDCAEWSVKACPFLSRPGMVRREDEMTEANKENVAGEMIDRNPGVAAIYVTKGVRVVRDEKGLPLFRPGKPESVSWWREGRPATLAEVLASLDTGMPFLVEMCETAQDLAALKHAFNQAVPWLPKEDDHEL